MRAQLYPSNPDLDEYDEEEVDDLFDQLVNGGDAAER